MTTTDKKTSPTKGGVAADNGFTAEEQQWVDKKKYAWILSMVPRRHPSEHLGHRRVDEGHQCA
jgi:alkane 1-monooxygenase